jgi:DNA-binding transcriptional LysR family regulator
MIELLLLRYVQAAAETGSFSRAAERFGVKQSTLSDSIRCLESRLGLALFKRSTRGVIPTDPGQRFLQRARHILEDFDRLLTDTRSLATGSIGVLQIGFHTSLTTGHLSESLAMFRAANKGVEIEACELNRRAMLTAVERGHLDLAITAGRASSPGMRSLCLWSERLIAAVPSDHPLAHRERLHWTDLEGATFIVSADDPGPDIQALINARLASPGHAPDIRVQRVGRDNLLSFAEGGNIVIGIGFPARRSPSAPTLHSVHDAFAATSLEQCLVWRADNDSPPLRRFLAMMTERYGRTIDE